MCEIISGILGYIEIDRFKVLIFYYHLYFYYYLLIILEREGVVILHCYENTIQRSIKEHTNRYRYLEKHSDPINHLTYICIFIEG